MTTHILINEVKVVYINKGATMSIGQSAIQNRNNSKSNGGVFLIGDGASHLPVHSIQNIDQDGIDTFSIDANNYSGPSA